MQVLDPTAPLSESEWAALLAEPISVWETEPWRLTVRDRLDLLAQIRAERARLAAREADVLVALAGPVRRERTVQIEPDEGDDRPRSFTLVDETVDLIAASTQRSTGTVRRQVAVARALHERLPRTRDALASGRISPEHAEAIARSLDGLEGSVLAAAESRVLAKAPSLTPAETASLARRLRARLDAAGEEARRHDARRHVDVRLWAEDDGLACMLARLPMADAARVHAAIQAQALATPVAEDATMGERRVAALVAALCGANEGATGVEVQVVIDLPSLLGQSDGHAMVALGPGAPEPLSAAAVRALLADDSVPATLRRLVVEPGDGTLLDRGRRAYRVTDAMRAYLASRDGVCGFPHCTRPALRCDVDHVVPWDDGGPTDRDNLVPLCRRHHVLKTHAQWRIAERRDDGVVVWVGPNGREYVSVPFGVTRAFARWDPDPPPDRPPRVRPVAVHAVGADPPF